MYCLCYNNDISQWVGVNDCEYKKENSKRNNEAATSLLQIF